ncbi:MAG: serine/threonine protein kinase [Bdellovibrionota bacterium]
MDLSQSFYNLDPSHVLNSIEDALDCSNIPSRRCTGRLMPLNSIENRVYALDLEDGTELVTKFYRPGRWTRRQIAEEHEFLRALHEADLSVIQPLPLVKGLSECPTLAISSSGIHLAIFPRSRARLKSELMPEEIPLLGRLLARVHNVGRGLKLPSRLKLNATTYGTEPFKFLQQSAFTESPMGMRYLQTVEELLPFLKLRLQNLPTQPVHGDCHVGNILWDGERPFLTDFDDCVHAPVVQDFWLICQGRDDESLKRRDAMIDAYEEISSFSWETLDAVEALRALRMIHYSAWVARRWEDPSFPKIFANFGSDNWWREEIEALSDCYEHLNS